MKPLVALVLVALHYATLSFSAKKIEKQYQKAIWLYILIVIVGMLTGSSPIFANFGKNLWIHAGVQEADYRP